MEFDLVYHSWTTLFAFVTFIGIFGCFVTFVLGVQATKVFVAFISFTLIAVISLLACLTTQFSTRQQNDTKFSQQLMDEYGATSDKSFDSIRNDLEKYNEATTKFTRDGSETTVFVKQVSDKNGKLEMIFSVIDEQSLYPKVKNG